MPLHQAAWDDVRQLAALTANALLTEDASEREGMHFQFHRESLEHVIAAATGLRPARRDMLQVISYWTAAFLTGIRACDEYLQALERPTG
jgi:hypothetical protein